MITNALRKMMNGTEIIRKPSKEMHGYTSMNYDTAKKFGFPWPYKKDAIVVDTHEHGIHLIRDIIHEKVEKRYEDKGWPYWKSHKKAECAERKIR
jgi:phage gpG-like protein